VVVGIKLKHTYTMFGIARFENNLAIHSSNIYITQQQYSKMQQFNDQHDARCMLCDACGHHITQLDINDLVSSLEAQLAEKNERIIAVECERDETVRKLTESSEIATRLEREKQEFEDKYNELYGKIYRIGRELGEYKKYYLENKIRDLRDANMAMERQIEMNGHRLHMLQQAKIMGDLHIAAINEIVASKDIPQFSDDEQPAEFSQMADNI